MTASSPHELRTGEPVARPCNFRTAWTQLEAELIKVGAAAVGEERIGGTVAEPVDLNSTASSAQDLYSHGFRRAYDRLRNGVYRNVRQGLVCVLHFCDFIDGLQRHLSHKVVT
eukprot:CAMPEP_0185553196 /NCGR_PEP_ID=MMETSP1381-20130426/36834_1 /TAXON_ID=298111 /ORGANISM="Pavlova sp., Strain CCMP459" /LENGTH=112 /DNA_ID=CAMNT_0028166279 /DNA_START=167 /DNA_END=502 /DNA_ORIENTATION=+